MTRWMGRGVGDFQHRGRQGGVGTTGSLFPWVPVTPLPLSGGPARSCLCGWEHGPGLDGWCLWAHQGHWPFNKKLRKEGSFEQSFETPAPWRSKRRFPNKRRPQSGTGAQPLSPTWDTPTWDKSLKGSDSYLGVGVSQVKDLVLLLLLQQTPCINSVQVCHELIIPRNLFICRPMEQLMFCGVLKLN